MRKPKHIHEHRNKLHVVIVVFLYISYVIYSVFLYRIIKLSKGICVIYVPHVELECYPPPLTWFLIIHVMFGTFMGFRK